MQNIVLLVLFVLGIVFIQFGEGQTVEDIIFKYLEVRGGKHHLNSIASLYMLGYRKMLDKNIPIKITIVNGKLFRTDFELEGKAGYTIVTPTQGWSFIPMQSQHVQVIAPAILAFMQLQLDIAGALVDHAIKGYKAELKGKENIGESEAHKIKLTSSKGKEVFYFIDSKTYLLRQIREIRTGENGKPQELVINLSDYKAVEGILFPHTISTPLGSPFTGTTKYNSIVINKVIAKINISHQ